MVSIVLSICLALNLALFVYVKKRFNKYDKVNAEQWEVINKSIDIIAKSCEDIVNIATLVEAMATDVITLNSDNSLTKIVVTELISSHEKKQEAINKLVAADSFNKENIKLLVESFNNKAKSDKKLMESLKSFLDKNDISEEDIPEKKIFN